MTDKIIQIYKNDVLTFPFGIDKLPYIEFEEKDPNIFFSNRALKSNYNINDVITFFSKIIKVNNEAVLFIGNEGEEKEYLEKLVLELNLENNIRFTGYLNSKTQNEIYKKCTYFISIPTSDSTSVSLLEAMSFGCIPIVSDIPANREWIHNEINGFYFSSNLNVLKILNDNNIENKFYINRKIIQERCIWSMNILELKNKIDEIIKN